MMILLLLNTVLAEPNTAPRQIDPNDIIFKPGSGLKITSQDDEFSLALRLRSQMLYTLDQEDPNQEWTQGMQIRRARLTFKGNVFGAHNKYKFELAVSPKDIGLKPMEGLSRSPLLDYYFHFDHLNNLNLRMGQYKLPYSRQRVVSSGNLQLVDRSLANAEFNLDRDVGLDLRSKNLFSQDMFRYHLGIFMGEGHSSYQSSTFDFLYLGRLEVLPFGFFADYSESNLSRNSEPKLSLGMAFAYIDEAKRNSGIIGDIPLDGGTTDIWNATGDLSYRQGSFSFDGAVFWREGQRNTESIEATQIEAPRNGLGYYAQMGVLLPRQLEISGRYGKTMPISDESSLDESNELGFGVNRYMAKHSFKIQADYFRLWSLDQFSDGGNRIRFQIQMAY
jgi:phosphate-selective porin OprO and OprP